MSRNVNERYHIRLIAAAELLLKGPSSVQIPFDFWGWSYLQLRRQVYPKGSGVIETRTIYANPENKEQEKIGLLRVASWDAAAAKLEARRLYEKKQNPDRQEPAVSHHYVTVPLEWLQEVLGKLDGISAPLLISPGPDQWLSLRHQLSLVKSDWTVFEVSWSEYEGAFAQLQAVWQQTWLEMGKFLQDVERIELEEQWDFNRMLVYEKEFFISDK